MQNAPWQWRLGSEIGGFESDDIGLLFMFSGLQVARADVLLS